MNEHDWPPDLDRDARCYWCGLRYSAWSEDDPGCPGERQR